MSLDAKRSVASKFFDWGCDAVQQARECPEAVRAFRALGARAAQSTTEADFLAPASRADKRIQYRRMRSESFLRFVDNSLREKVR